MLKRTIFVLILALSIFSMVIPAFARETADEEQGMADAINSMVSREKVKVEVLPFEIEMKRKIEQEKPKPTLPEQPVFIKQINVVSVTVLPPKDIEEIVAEFKNKALSAKEMQRCANQISDAYALKGYITSYAYIDPVNLDQGILQIKCVEGKVGDIQVKGNHYFSAAVYSDRIGLKKGDIFNYKKLMNNAFRTNRHPDRKVKIEPSQDGELTNITVAATDKLPLHFTIDHDNYGSQFVHYKRFKNTLTFNNFTGHDDVLNLKVQLCQSDTQRLFDLDYFLPLNNTWKWEFYIMPYKKENYVDQDNKDNDFEKKAWKWYTYLYQTIFSEPNRELVLNYGFVQKDINWWSQGSRQKWDHFRAVLLGFDYVRSDAYGTWVVSEDAEKGVPDIWGGASPKDSNCSVKGAGGKYFKNKVYIARRQKLFWDIDFNMKIQGQYSTQALTGVNVFSVGGFMGTIDNRGYPRAQMPMDSGYYLMGGFTIPAYFVPKSAKLPLCKSTVYDNLKLFTFFEYAKGYKKSPQSALAKVGSTTPDTGDKNDDDRRKSLKSAGCGFQFAVPEQNLSMRMDIGWPLDHKVGKDGDHCHIWYRVTKTF